MGFPCLSEMHFIGNKLSEKFFIMKYNVTSSLGLLDGGSAGRTDGHTDKAIVGVGWKTLKKQWKIYLSKVSIFAFLLLKKSPCKKGGFRVWLKKHFIEDKMTKKFFIECIFKDELSKSFFLTNSAKTWQFWIAASAEGTFIVDQNLNLVGRELDLEKHLCTLLSFSFDKVWFSWLKTSCW